MKNLLNVFLIICLAVGLYAQSDTTPETTSINTSSETTKPSTEPSTTQPSKSSSEEPITSSIEPPKTSQTPTTTSSVPTTSTTPAPPPTTPETTTKTTPNTTTAIPETSTALPTSTTLEPSPATTKMPIPVPEEGHWNVVDGNTTCIRAALKIRFKISMLNQIDYIVLSPNASSKGSKCDASNVTQTLLLTDSEYKLQFTFEKDADSVYVKETDFSFQLPELTEQVSNDTQMFKVKSGNSYMCKTSADIMLGNVTMEVFSIQIQAFGSAGNSGFGTAEECVADNQVNDIVPIAVGVALLALVVVVLIAYLVGRRRSRQKGYQSV